MLAPENAPSRQRGEPFAWRIKNWIRPLGLKLFGLPTQLFGTGMASRSVCSWDRDLGNSRLAEDCALGIALASAGYPPLFVSEARVHSHFPCRRLAASCSASVGRRGISRILSTWFRGLLPDRCAVEPLGWLRSPSTWRCLLYRCSCLLWPSADPRRSSVFAGRIVRRSCHSLVVRSACCARGGACVAGCWSRRPAASRISPSSPTCYPEIGFLSRIASGKASSAWNTDCKRRRRSWQRSA